MNIQAASLQTISPQWAAPENIRALTTTRKGGVSQPPWDGFNLATHVNDNLDDVMENRRLLKQHANLPNEPTWLEQVHSNEAVQLTKQNAKQLFRADATYTTETNIVCCVMTADCLPVLFCNKQATWVAAAHAGWKGLANGILKNVMAMYIKQGAGQLSDLLVWIGPAISGRVYQVEGDVKEALERQDPGLEKAFTAQDEEHFLLDSRYAAQLQLVENGLHESQIATEDFCTYQDDKRFYSYRRDGLNTGRMASMIWLDNS